MTLSPIPPLDQAETEALAALAETIIPPSEKYGLPGAGDPDILAAIVSDGRRRLAALKDALESLDAMADASHGRRFADLDSAARFTVGESYRTAHPGHAEMVQNLAAQCYYRDMRVMVSLGMDPRPPHPRGFEVKDGDWSLLDPVRRRDSLVRPTG